MGDFDRLFNCMDQISSRKFNVIFWITTAALFVVAVALRWYRLDLMMFRYDQAEVAFRAMETFGAGFPLTGIVNSLGFRNAGGYAWTVLPAFLISPDPRLATAWHGLLASTIIFPLALLGRRYRSDGLALLPAVIAAVVPVSVFAGRNLWAQHLLPALAAWAIYYLDRALRQDLPPKKKRRAAGICLAVLAWATSVHFSAGVLLLVSSLFLLVEFKRQLKELIRAGIPALVIALTMLPSVVSFWDSRTNPSPKPDFAVVYESMLPPPFPWWVRLQDSIKFSFWNPSVEAAPGMAVLLENTVTEWLTLSTLLDAFITGIAAAGTIAVIAIVLRRKRRSPTDEGLTLATILLAWIFVPAVVGGLLVQRINAGYFLGSMVAFWLLPLCLPRLKGRTAVASSMAAAIFFCWGGMTTGVFLALIKHKEFVPGNYYIPFGKQMEVVDYLRESDVKPGNLIHLSGGWYQHSYDYLHRYVGTSGKAERTKPAGQPYAVMEDRNLRLDEPGRMRFFESQNPVYFDNENAVGVLIFRGRGSAEVFVQQYYDTQER